MPAVAQKLFRIKSVSQSKLTVPGSAGINDIAQNADSSNAMIAPEPAFAAAR